MQTITEEEDEDGDLMVLLSEQNIELIQSGPAASDHDGNFGGPSEVPSGACQQSQQAVYLHIIREIISKFALIYFMYRPLLQEAEIVKTWIKLLMTITFQLLRLQLTCQQPTIRREILS